MLTRRKVLQAQVAGITLILCEPWKLEASLSSATTPLP